MRSNTEYFIFSAFVVLIGAGNVFDYAFLLFFAILGTSGFYKFSIQDGATVLRETVEFAWERRG